MLKKLRNFFPLDEIKLHNNIPIILIQHVVIFIYINANELVIFKTYI